jgi:hypothetical protein
MSCWRISQKGSFQLMRVRSCLNCILIEEGERGERGWVFVYMKVVVLRWKRRMRKRETVDTYGCIILFSS